MDIKELKKLLKNSTSVLVLDNGEPSFVVMGYKTYKDLSLNRTEEREIPVRNNLNSDRDYYHPSQTYPERVRYDDRVPTYFNRDKETEILERLNKEILALKSQIEAEEGRLVNPHRDGIDL